MLSIRNKLKHSLAVTLMLALALALMPITAASAGGPVVHRVSAGGPDACVAFGLHPGCDANFSLVGIVYADGSMSGQYTDRFANGNGFHAVIDCVSVAGNDAWVSGVITSGTFTFPDGEVLDLTGLPVATRVRDNGVSANDPPDDVSFSFFGDPTPCTEHVDYPLFTSSQGQVVIR